jgi:hypothetical protein
MLSHLELRKDVARNKKKLGLQPWEVDSKANYYNRKK